MYLCIKEKKTNVFTSGKDASKPKKDDFVKHAAGKDHCAARQAKPQRTGMEIATKTAYQRVERAIISLMRSIYFQAKKNIANMVLSDLVELQVENGCEELRILMKLESQPLYTHHASADDFRDSMAKVVEDGYLLEVINAKYFALMMDESTDVAIQQTLMVYVRIVDDDGRVRTHFLSTVRLDAADATGIYKAAYDVMTSKGFDHQRLIALATDGASVMTGVETGVTTRFKADNPFLFATHCLAHRLALASSQAADKVKYLVKYQSVVNVIYKYFEQSPKNTRLFNLVKGTLLGIEDCESAAPFKQTFGTRWLSFSRAVNAIAEHADNLLTCIHTDAEDRSTRIKAQALIKNIGKYSFFAVTHMLKVSRGGRGMFEHRGTFAPCW